MDRRTFLLTPLALVAADRKPNVLLLLASGWRAQATPWAGDPDLAAPNLEKFGQQGVVFDRAYSCYPRSSPARAALATGRYPHTTGVIGENDRLPADEVTLDAALKSDNYAVGRVPPAGAAVFLGSHKSGPFFLTVPLESTPAAQPLDAAQLHPRENVPSNDELDARKELAARYANYAALDSSVGQIMASVDTLGLAGNTIVVFTSDHGEQMGSQGLDGDDVPFEESVRIPLAIRYPDVLPSGTKSELLVSQVDLMPTLLAWCGAPAPEGIQGHDLSGPISGHGERPESVFAEGKIGDKDEWRMLVLGSDKLVVNSQTEITHLYNLADDPYELTNLAHEPGVRLQRDGLLAALRASERKLADFKRR
jgi:arylsulfatase A-like enzyme